MFELKPLGDRILIKLTREDEKKVGDTVITLQRSTKARVQPETSKYLVVATGQETDPQIKEGMYVVCRSDAGAVLSRDVIDRDDHRLFRLVDTPEVLCILEESYKAMTPQDVLPREKVVI